MNMNGISDHTAFANIGTESVSRAVPAEQIAGASTEQLEAGASGRFDEFVRGDQPESRSSGIYSIPKDGQQAKGEKGLLDQLKDQMAKQDDPTQGESGPKRIGTMGSLEKICRREGPNGTCNHNDDTPGAYTEQPIYG